MELPLDEEDGTFTNISLADDAEHLSSRASLKQSSWKAERAHTTMMNADMDAVEAENQVELEEKTRLINQVLELQHTLEDLSARVDAVKEENLKLKSENQVLGQYIENLMSASSVFQTTDTKSKRK
ncbi:short coiled-coil protein isoform X2 [Cuculus canorus]|uniref:short coiled-coil protein isoform X2 n=1 Tax=Cuculus canorus TaxID=55661 RepID=UPI0023AA2802|nr:short coiled-coil protein isoform X2 [Cuculus canorus]